MLARLTVPSPGSCWCAVADALQKDRRSMVLPPCGVAYKCLVPPPQKKKKTEERNSNWLNSNRRNITKKVAVIRFDSLTHDTMDRWFKSKKNWTWNSLWCAFLKKNRETFVYFFFFNFFTLVVWRRRRSCWGNCCSSCDLFVSWV